jgi:hypothetical protein
MSLNKNKIATLTKNIDEIQNYIKIEKENYNDIILKYQNNIEQLKLEQESVTLTLEQYLEELNNKEKEIYKIQSSNLELIKNNLNKYIQINNNLKEQTLKKTKEIEEFEVIENSQYDKLNMFFEDLDATNYLRENFQNKLKDIEKGIEKIKQSYPKDFKFLLDDFENNERKVRIKICMNKMNEKSKENINNNEELKKKLEDDNQVLLEKEKLYNQISETINFQLKKDTSLKIIGDSIKKFLRENLNFSLIRGILEKFFSKKDFEIDNKLEKKELNDLVLHLDFARNEFNNYYDVKNDEMESKGRQIQEINSIRPSKQTNKIEEIKKNFVELSKDVLMLKNIIDYLSEMIKNYYNLLINDNYTYVIFDNLDENFFNQILDIIYFCLKEDTFENRNELKSKFFLFIAKLKTKYIEMKNLNQQLKLLGNEVNKIKDTINKTNEKIENNIKENSQFDEELLKCNNSLKIINDTIELKNKEIRKNLGELKNEHFEKYLKQNEKLFKQILENGNKVKNNELSLTKNYFINQILIDHSLKKNTLQDYLEKKFKISDKLVFYLDDLNYLKTTCEKEKEEYKPMKKKIIQLNKEAMLLEKNSNDISKVIDECISGLEEKTLQQKTQLQNEKNIPFYINQIKSINNKLESINKNIESENNNFEIKKKEFENRIQALNNELSKLKGKKNKIISPEKKNPENNNLEENNNIIISAYSRINPILNQQINKISPQKTFHNMETKGIILYKKVNNNARNFDFKNSKNFPPEKCGYIKRIFLYFSKNNLLIIKDIRLNAIETKINIENIKNIMLNPTTKNIIKNEKEKNNNYSILDKGPFIQFFLNLSEGNIDIIAPNYISYEQFYNFISLIKKYPKSIKENIIEDDFSLTNTIVI